MFVGLVLAALLGGPPAEGVHANERVQYKTTLFQVARDADAKFAGSRCDDAHIERINTAPWKIESQPSLVVWRERLRITGCGRSTIEIVNVGRFGGASPWRMVGNVPGDTIADMTLQLSTYP